MELDPQNWTQVLPLAAVGLVAGFLNVLAGGGSLLTLPVMLWLGMPAPIANATNRIGLVTQNIAASAAFHQGGVMPWTAASRLAMAMVPGALIGAWLAVDIDETTFRRILVAVMIFSLWTIVRGSSQPHPDGGSHRRKRWLLLVSFFFMGIYAGFMQAGLGFVIIAVLSSLGGYDLVRTNALKVALVLVVQLGALVIFASAGTVDWLAGASLALGSTLGAWVGAHMQLARGSVWVRRVVIGLLVSFTVRLVYEGFVA